MCEINNPFSPQVGFGQGFIITTERLVRIPGNGPWRFVLYLTYFPTACPSLLSLVPAIPKLLTLQSNAEASRGLLRCCQWVSVQRSAVFFSQNRPGVWQWDGLFLLPRHGCILGHSSAHWTTEGDFLLQNWGAHRPHHPWSPDNVNMVQEFTFTWCFHVYVLFNPVLMFIMDFQIWPCVHIVPRQTSKVEDLVPDFVYFHSEHTHKDACRHLLYADFSSMG